MLICFVASSTIVKTVVPFLKITDSVGAKSISSHHIGPLIIKNNKKLKL